MRYTNLTKYQLAVVAGLVLPLGSVSLTASADPVQDLENCASITVEVERLACYDAAYAQLQAAGMTSDSILEKRVLRVEVPVPVPAASPAGGAIPQPDAKTKSFGSGFGLPFFGKKKDETPESFGKPVETVQRDSEGIVKSITARVVSVEKSSVGRPTVLLDNGQRWRPNEGNLKPKVGDMARVRRGGMGGYFLSLNEGRGVRATRQDDGDVPPASTSMSVPVVTPPVVTPSVPDVVPEKKAKKEKKKKKGFLNRLRHPFGGGDDEDADTAEGAAKAATEAPKASGGQSFKVKAVLQDPMGNYIITLENGQVWQQQAGQLDIRAGDTVVIKGTAFGGNELQVAGKGSVVPVTRID